MRLLKFLMTAAILTVLSLIYIQLQVQIYDLGYQGENRKVAVQRLMDDNSFATSNIYKLKSANNLGIKLLADNSGMKFLDNRHIVKLEAPTELLDRADLAKTRIEMNQLAKRPSLLAGIFSLKSQAEAEPIK